MANAVYIESLLGGMDRGLRRALRAAFEYLLGNLRFGHPVANERTENHQLYFVEGRTSVVANTEFTVAHKLGVAPYLAIQVIDLQAVNTQMVRLRVERAADTSRLYLSSPDVNAPFTLMIEG